MEKISELPRTRAQPLLFLILFLLWGLPLSLFTLFFHITPTPGLLYFVPRQFFSFHCTFLVLPSLSLHERSRYLVTSLLLEVKISTPSCVMYFKSRRPPPTLLLRAYFFPPPFPPHPMLSSFVHSVYTCTPTSTAFSL
jgi:hypothetical protein